VNDILCTKLRHTDQSGVNLLLNTKLALAILDFDAAAGGPLSQRFFKLSIRGTSCV